jgi:hypothetical protein
MTESQQAAMDGAQTAREQRRADDTRRRERTQKVIDDFGQDAQKGSATPERVDKFVDDFHEA